MPPHREDLKKSGLSEELIKCHRLFSIGPNTLERLLGFSTRGADSGMVIPFPSPLGGGFIDHIRVKVFPPLKDAAGHTIKYLQPRGSGLRLFFPLQTLKNALTSGDPLWLVEGEKKSLAVAQLDLPAVGVCGIQGWRRAGTSELIADFDCINVRGRRVELVPDGDWQLNPQVARGAFGLAEALEARGAQVRLVVLPLEAAR
jgi:hypothetical protein